MAQQTAIEWLIQQVNSEQYQIAFGQTYISIDLIKQAKQMEKEQMKGMYVEGGVAQMRYIDGKGFITAEQYYNETYNK